MSRGGQGRGPDDRGQVEQAAESRGKMEYYKRRMYTYRKFRGGSREARWCTRVWARWHQVSVTLARNLGYFLLRASPSRTTILIALPLMLLSLPGPESCGPETGDHQQKARSTVTKDLSVGLEG